MAKKDQLSIYLSWVLRHSPEALGLDMDRRGWVSVDRLLDGVNAAGKHTLTQEQLRDIVATDAKGRYRFSEDGTRIKACQGHTVPWVEPELEFLPPPRWLYHGTTTEAVGAIMDSGGISKMGRHAVHMHGELWEAWRSARRRRGKRPAVLKIDGEALAASGMAVGRTENGGWCCERVPRAFIADILYE